MSATEAFGTHPTSLLSQLVPQQPQSRHQSPGQWRRSRVKDLRCQTSYQQGNCRLCRQSVGREPKTADQKAADDVRQDTSRCRPQKKRGQEVWRSWRPSQIPEELPINCCVIL